jgi:hypothetical protein
VADLGNDKRKKYSGYDCVYRRGALLHSYVIWKFMDIALPVLYSES